jgi:hypothetical protein
VNEPRNHTALIDRFGDTWIRVDELPGQFGGTWWPLTDGVGWDPNARNGIGKAREWRQMAEYGPFEVADGARTRRALARVEEEAAR